MALAWLLGKGNGFGVDIVPIPGTKRRQYLEENIAAASLKLDAAEMAALDEALAPGKSPAPAMANAAWRWSTGSALGLDSESEAGFLKKPQSNAEKA